MTDYIKMLRKRFVTDAEQKKLRQPALEPYALAQEWHERGLPDHRRAVERLQAVLRREKPYVWPDEKIAMIRTVPVLPEIFTQEEWADLRAKYTIHEQGKVCNITP